MIQQQLGVKGVFGVPKELRPIVGAPEGKQRLRLRTAQFAEFYVKNDTGIRRFHLRDDTEHWTVLYENGRNVRPSPMRLKDIRDFHIGRGHYE